MLGVARRYAWYRHPITVSLRRPLPAPWLNAFHGRRLTILAIETSCDDTAVAILEVKSDLQSTERPAHKAELLFNEKITSNNLAYGGIHPLVALESHRKHLSGLLQKAILSLAPARTEISKVLQPSSHNGLQSRRPDVVAVTRGPGMRSNLMAGLDTAKGLAVAWNVPLIGVHHMQAHALTPRLCAALEKNTASTARAMGPQPAFPFLTLLVSGGHTLLVHSTGVADHRILASTDDIAIGDCLDKCARSILPQSLLESSTDVSYGKLLETFAFPNPGPEAYDETPLSRSRGSSAFQSPYGWQLPIPLLATGGGRKRKSMQFSYTGLVTSATRVAQNGWVNGRLGKEPRKVPMPEEEARCLAREVMRIAFEHLASRVTLQLRREVIAHGIMPTTPLSKAIIISGGVAANQYLHHVFQSQPSLAHLKVVIPPIDLCTDNAAMIAWAAHEMLPILDPTSALSMSKTSVEQLTRTQAQLEMDVLKKWSLENILHPEKELDSRHVVGDAAIMGARGPSVPVLPGDGPTGLMKQESYKHKSRVVELRESGVYAPSMDSVQAPISSKAATAVKDGFSLLSSEDVINYLQQLQDDKSSRHPMRQSIGVSNNNLDQTILKSEKTLRSQPEPPSTMSDSRDPLSPQFRSSSATFLNTTDDYRTLWEKYTLPDDGKEADDETLHRRSRMIKLYEPSRDPPHVQPPELVRALNGPMQRRWLKALLRTTQPNLYQGCRAKPKRIRYLSPHFRRFQQVIDPVKFALWILPLEKHFAMQKQLGDSALGPCRLRDQEEENKYKRWWVHALLCLEEPQSELAERLDRVHSSHLELYDIEDVQNKVIDLLKIYGWNVDGTRADTVDSDTQNSPSIAITDQHGEEQADQTVLQSDSLESCMSVANVESYEMPSHLDECKSTDSARTAKFEHLGASMTSSEREHEHDHPKCSIKRMIENERDFIAKIRSAPRNRNAPVSSKAEEAENIHVPNQPVAEKASVIEKAASQSQSQYLSEDVGDETGRDMQASEKHEGVTFGGRRLGHMIRWLGFEGPLK